MHIFNYFCTVNDTKWIRKIQLKKNHFWSADQTQRSLKRKYTRGEFVNGYFKTILELSHCNCTTATCAWNSMNISGLSGKANIHIKQT